MTVSLRAFRQEDLPLIERWASAGDLDRYLSRMRPRDVQAGHHDPQNGLFWFVIVDSGAEVGTVWLEPGERPDESTLGVFLSHPSLLGRGIGARAIRLAVDECRARHPAQVVTLRVREGNARAIACYQKAGFATVSSGTKVLSSGEHLPYFRMRLLPSRTPPA
jgi:RimJ/RimL family protein N-acetyltransferase